MKYLQRQMSFFDKRWIFTVLFFTITTCLVQSQVLIALVLGDKLNSDKLAFGLNAGTNFAVSPELDSKNLLPALELGLFLDVRLNERFIVRPEIYFSRVYKMKGMDPTPYYPEYVLDEYEEYDVHLKRQMEYMGIGGIFCTRVIDYFYVDLGFDLQLLIRASDVLTGSHGTNKLELTHGFTKENNRIDPGLVGGISYRLRQGKGVSINARYRFGFTKYDYELPAHNNEGFYITASIPIKGVSKDKAKD